MMVEIVDNSLVISQNLNPDSTKFFFKYPKESRFNTLFKLLKKKNKKRKKLIVDPKYIMLDLDKRTSIIIKNIPDDITSIQFENIILNFSKDIDFFFVPNSVKTRKNLRVAFINAINYKQIVSIYMGLMYKVKFVYSNPNIELEICYSKVQGRDELIKRFLSELQTNKDNKNDVNDYFI